MKTLFIALLAGSLLTNAWLLQRSPSNRDATPSNAARRTPEAATAPAHPVPPTEAAAREIARALSSGDIATLRDGLTAAGADAATVRGLVEGVLRRRYEKHASDWRIERIRTMWWRGGSSAARGDNAPSDQAMVRKPLQTLLGTDLLDLADAELRYEFLSPEKRRLLALIDLDYIDMQANAAPGGLSNAPTKAEVDEQDLLMRERKKDTLTALTAEERAEYELHFSSLVMNNVRRFSAMEANEQEFRTIIPLIDAFDRQMKTLRSGDPNYLTALNEIEQHTMDGLVATLGYERALDYCWAAGSGPYVPTVRLLRELQLPTTRAAQLLQLAAETGVQGAAIHGDPTLTVDQKREALAALQGAVRPRLDALVPPASQDRLPPEAITWFTALGEGRYASHRTTAYSNVWFAATPIAVTTPPRTPLPAVPLPRR